MLPVAVINPEVMMFPPVTLAADVMVEVAEIKPAVSKLPPVTLPVAVTSPAVEILPLITFPVALVVVAAKVIVATLLTELILIPLVALAHGTSTRLALPRALPENTIALSFKVERLL